MRLNVVKISLLSSLIYRFYAIPMKISARFIRQVNLKIYMRGGVKMAVWEDEELVSPQLGCLLAASGGSHPQGDGRNPTVNQ